MKSKIENILINSFLTGTAVGIKLRDSDVLIATAVTNLDTLNVMDNWIEIRQYTLYGYPVERTVIHANEIESVIPFTVHYDDPVYVRLRELRAKKFRLRIVTS